MNMAFISALLFSEFSFFWFLVVEDSEVCLFQNSEDSEIPKEYALVDFTGEVSHSQKNGPSDFGRFRRLQLKNEALKPSCHKENTSERESFQSLRSLVYDQNF